MTQEEIAEPENLAKTFREFAYVVSHDLGAPLRAMVQFSRLLKAERVQALSDESNLYLSMIIENGEKAQGMLGALLEYSRLNTTSNPFELTDLNQLMKQCQEDLAEKITGKKASLSIDSLPVIHSDATQMKRLLLSLLENALTFHLPDQVPEIKLSAEKRDGELIFTMHDSGIGIDSRFHEKIFLPFRRLHPEGKYPGVGMGLTLAKRVVDRHGGRIWLESEAGRGARFMVAFPEKMAG